MCSNREKLKYVNNYLFFFKKTSTSGISEIEQPKPAASVTLRPTFWGLCQLNFMVAGNLVHIQVAEN